MEDPISVTARRSKRRAADAISPLKPSPSISTEATSITPTKRRSKRVRFSTGSTASTINTTNLPSGTTGLTPAIARQRLATPGTKCRVSTPAPSRSISLSVTLPPSSPAIDGEVQFTPLRQVLDGRMQRRIKRNHMAEEVEGYDRDRKQMRDLQKEIQGKDAELKRLKMQVASNTEAQRSAAVLDPIPEAPDAREQVGERIDDIEAELSLLRQSFQQFEDADQPNLNHDDAEGFLGGGEDWAGVPHTFSTGAQSDSGDTIRIYEDDPSIHYPSTARLSSSADAQDAVIMGLELESAQQAKKNFLQSASSRRSVGPSDLRFEDSPAKVIRHTTSRMPIINGDVLAVLNRQVKAANARAEDAELALEALEGEVRALSSGFTENHDAHEGLKALADHFRHVRLELERVFPGEVSLGLDAHHALLPELITKLKTIMTQLNTTNLEYQNLRTQEKTLRGNFDQAAHAHRAAQQKLDSLSRKTEDLEKSLEEYTETLLHERIRATRSETHVKELDSDNSALKAALDTYRSDVSRLEALISTMEAEHRLALADIHSTSNATISDLQAQAAAETTGRQRAEESAVSRLRKIQSLEDKLQHAKDHAGEVELTLVQEIGGLNSRLSGVSTALAAADQETERLRRLLAKCEKRYRDEVYRGEETVRAMRDEMMKAASRVVGSAKGFRRASKVSLANWELESSSDDAQVDEAGVPMTPSSTVRFADYSEVRDLGSEDGETDLEDDEDEAEQPGRQRRERERERDVETDNSNNNHTEGDDDDEEEEHIPGSVEVARGKKKSVLLLPTPTPTPTTSVAAAAAAAKPPAKPATGNRKPRRKYDSGIGIDDVVEDDGGFDQDAGLDDSGLATPDLSSDVDVDVEMESALPLALQPAF